MPTLTDLTALVEKYAAAVPNLNLDGDEQEEYSTMLLWLQNQLETGEPSEAIVTECLAYFARFSRDVEPGSPKVIVVDDEPLIADSLARILNIYGFQAKTAYNPSQAFEHIRSQPCELVITDVFMRGQMSGVELAIELTKVLPGCKVLLMSGNAATTEFLKTAKEKGHSFEVVAKPVHPMVIIERLKTLSSRSVPAQAD